MAFKTVFVAVGAEQGVTELDRAAVICGRIDAHLTILVLGIAPPPPATPYGVVSNEMWAGEIRDGQGEIERRADEIRSRLEARGIRFGVEAHFIDRGTVATLAARFARYADLTLITPHADGHKNQQVWVMNGALFESGRPILVLPGGETTFPEPRRVMIAWDASVEASKAVRDAIGLMRQAAAVDAVLIDPVPSFEGHGAEPGADLAAYLARHGISTEIHRIPREGREVGELLRRSALDFGADLIVMGGFGHSRLRQRIFGGTTTSMIDDTPVAVLMAH